MDFKAARRMELFSQYGVAAAKEALEDSGLDMAKEDPFRAGVIVGSGIGSLHTIEKEYEKILNGKVNRVNPLMVPLMISNMAAGNISIQLGLRGKCTNVVTACASGMRILCLRAARRAVSTLRGWPDFRRLLHFLQRRIPLGRLFLLTRTGKALYWEKARELSC